VGVPRSARTGGISPTTDARSDAVAISADGRYVLFSSGATTLVPGDTNGTDDAFARDLATGRTWRVSTSRSGAQANGLSLARGMTADGHYALLLSRATNLVDPPTPAGGSYLYRRDLRTGAITRLDPAPR
jgi:hypothetical protein